MMTFRGMMKRIIAMPGKLMFDGKDPDLFDHFATVAQTDGNLYGSGLRADHRASAQGMGRGVGDGQREGGAGAGVPVRAAEVL